MRLKITETRLCNAQEWDDFAAACGATYFCAYGHVLSAKTHKRLRFFVASLDDTKIAQCAISQGWFGKSRRTRRFLDALQVLPTYQSYWADVVQAILTLIGPGEYCYGSRWSIETPRQDALAAMPHVEIVRTQQFCVQAVDFSRWPTWEAYEKALSLNVRRSITKALNVDPPPIVSIKFGRAALLEAFTLTRMRSATVRRKGHVGVDRSVAIVRYVARNIFLKKLTYTAKVSRCGRVLGYFAGVDLGNHTFYLDGASVPDNRGASWLLMVQMLRHAWQPNRKVFLGMYEPNTDWAGRENFLLSRQHLRVTDIPSEIVWFQYSGADNKRLF
jgi:hypothetical protein